MDGFVYAITGGLRRRAGSEHAAASADSPGVCTDALGCAESSARVRISSVAVEELGDFGACGYAHRVSFFRSRSKRAGGGRGGWVPLSAEFRFESRARADGHAAWISVCAAR